ncbi:MAG: Gfo/Idh/MocA family oxidoreductase [Acidobacteriota bacterium]
MSLPRIAVVGAGSFGKNHIRILHESPDAQLSGVFDSDLTRAATAAAERNCPVFTSLSELAAASDGAVVATPTVTHSEIGCQLMELGCDVLIEKPIAHDQAAGQALVDTAARTGRILQVGHLERFNPAVAALSKVVTTPLFFEVHRLSEFSPRSLDVDVVLDLMIHDLDIILSLTGKMPEEIRAAGIHILSERVDIANVRLQFPGGCVANLTASRISTERVRKLRLFQPHEYISLDYSRQDGARFSVGDNRKISFMPLAATKSEPLRLEVENFIECIRTRQQPRVTGTQALAALQVARDILVKIEEHSNVVAQSLHATGTP